MFLDFLDQNFTQKLENSPPFIKTKQYFLLSVLQHRSFGKTEWLLGIFSRFCKEFGHTHSSRTVKNPAQVHARFAAVLGSGLICHPEAAGSYTLRGNKAVCLHVAGKITSQDNIQSCEPSVV